MDNKCRPYLAVFPKAGLPVLKNAKDFTTDLEPQLHTMANAFANHSCDTLQYKMCHKSCAESRRCSKKCMEEKQKRYNEMIVLGRDEHVLRPVMEKLQRGEDPDTIVMIEFREFACSGVVLCTFSIFFNKFRGHPVIDLRRGPMSADTFEQVYKWMVQPNYIIKPENVVRLVRAANFLEIKFLLNDVYEILESNRYTDFWAFSIMTKSRHYTELFLLNQAMAMRISKAALIVICSQEFLTLNEMQIGAFLNSSSLAINSETELLYGVLHWLNVGWPARRTSVVNVLKNLRFAYLSPKILCEMNVNPMEPFARILREFANQPESKQLVEDGIFHSTLVITLNGDASKLKDLPNAKRELMMPRRWARDIRCPYHRPVTKLCPNMRSISYEEFAAYSETLLDTDADYERYFVYPQDDDGSETSSTDRSNYKENLNDSDDSKLSVWRTDSLLHWVRFECAPSFQMEDTLVTSIDSGSGVPSNSSLHDQAEVATEHWQKVLNKFKPSEIWDDWDEAFTEGDE